MMDYGYGEFDNAYDEESGQKMKTLVTGLLVGGLIGAVVMLFLAPASGKKTLRKLQKKTMKLRDQTMDTVEDAMRTAKQARRKASRATSGMLRQAEHMADRGQDVLEEQRERVSDVVSKGRRRAHLS